MMVPLFTPPEGQIVSQGALLDTAARHSILAFMEIAVDPALYDTFWVAGLAVSAGRGRVVKGMPVLQEPVWLPGQFA